MSEILVLVEQVDGEVKKVTLELLTLARSLGSPSAVWAGPGLTDAATAKLAEYGAEKVYNAPSSDVVDYVVAPRAELLAQLVGDKSPAAVLVASTAEGKEIAGRLAVKTDSGVITDAVGLAEGFVADQSIFGGGVNVHSRVAKGTPIVAVRPNSTAPAPAAGAGAVEEVAVSLSEGAKAARIVDRVKQEKGARPELTEAAIVVSGGRGVGSAENFSVIEGLADALGAAVGASRAATDAGWYPHQFQVGQTGKTVSPQLYIAAGISGAIQHRAGMQTAKTIIAINKDPEAPIFELADYGVVGDLHQVVPQLTEESTTRTSRPPAAAPRFPRGAASVVRAQATCALVRRAVTSHPASMPASTGRPWRLAKPARTSPATAARAGKAQAGTRARWVTSWKATAATTARAIGASGKSWETAITMA